MNLVVQAGQRLAERRFQLLDMCYEPANHFGPSLSIKAVKRLRIDDTASLLVVHTPPIE